MRASPEVVDGKSDENEADADQALARVAGDLIDDNRQADEREEHRHGWKAARPEARGVARRTTQGDGAQRERTEEDPLRVDDA